MSATKIAEELKSNLNITVSSSIVRHLLRIQGYRGRTARTKYYLNERNRKKRLEFARKLRKITDGVLEQGHLYE